jgi:hypothetical protein
VRHEAEEQVSFGLVVHGRPVEKMIHVARAANLSGEVPKLYDEDRTP